VIRVLFVCMGNICRSPTAEGIFRAQVREAGLSNLIATDSAGTHGYQVGEPPDHRAIEAAARRGIDITDLRARRVQAEDFRRFDLVLAMDRENLGQLNRLCPRDAVERPRLFMDFAPHIEARDVPDPYYGGADGFEHVLDLVEEASRGLLDHLRLIRLASGDGTPQPSKMAR
jgi:protein-tyrosine phosphatase